MVAKMCRLLHDAPRVAGWADSTAFACDGVIFHPATGVDADTVAQVQASLRLPLLRCGGQMRIIAFITHSADIRHILEQIGVACEPPHI